MVAKFADCEPEEAGLKGLRARFSLAVAGQGRMTYPECIGWFCVYIQFTKYTEKGSL